MKKILMTCMCAIAIPGIAFAEWQLVKNFNDESFDGIHTHDTNHWDDYHTVGITDIVPRPFDEAGGYSLATTAGFGLGNDFHVWINIPPIEDGSDGTLYVEFAQTDQANNTAFGTTNEPFPGDNDARWGNFYALARVHFGEFDVFDFSGYENVGTLAAETWYRVWFHVDNLNDEHSAYVQGGEWEEPTEIYADAIFRNEISVDDMVNFLIIQAAGNQTNPTSGQYVYWDNLHVDTTGFNLSVPEDDLDPVDPPDPGPDNPFERQHSGEWMDLDLNLGEFYAYQDGAGVSYHFTLGFVLSDSYPWLFSPEIGFFTHEAGEYDSEEGAYLYAPEIGWLNISSHRWDQILSFEGDEWVVWAD